MTDTQADHKTSRHLAVLAQCGLEIIDVVVVLIMLEVLMAVLQSIITVESYMESYVVIYATNSYTYYYYLFSITHSLFHPRLKNLPFLQILPTAAFPFLLQD